MVRDKPGRGSSRSWSSRHGDEEVWSGVVSSYVAFRAEVAARFRSHAYFSDIPSSPALCFLNADLQDLVAFCSTTTID